MTIIETSSYVPKYAFSNHDFKNIDTSDEWIESRTGIKNRYFAYDEEVLDMAYKACLKLRDKIIDDKLAGIIVATMTHHYVTPSCSALLQEKLHLPNDIFCTDINSACNGFVQALSLGQLLVSHEKPYVLIVASEKMSSLLDFQDRNTCVLFGDGAGACLCQKDDYYFGIQKTQSQSEDLYALKSDFHICMQGRHIFKFAVKAVPELINECLINASLHKEDIDYYILHQANKRIISHIYKNMNIDEKKFYCNVDKYGNTSSASIILALDDMNQKGLLKEAMKLMMIGFGAGLSYGSVLIKWRNQNVVK